MRIGQPGFGGGREAIRHERPPLARELANDRALPGIVPGQRKRTLRKLLGVWNIDGGRQCRHLADLIWSEGLRDFENPGLTAIEIGDRDCAVAGAEVDSKTETSAHEGGLSWLSCYQFASIAARNGKHRLYVVRLVVRQPADASSLISVPPRPEQLRGVDLSNSA